MICLYHGDNISESRAQIDKLRNNSGDLKVLEAQSLKLENLFQAIENNELFDENKRTIVIENPLKNKNLLTTFPEVSDNVDLIFWADEKLTPGEITTFQKKFPKLVVKEFKIAGAVFKFLDSLGQSPNKDFLDLWSEYLRQDIPENILLMIARQIRLLLLAKDPDRDESELWRKLSPWQRQKLETQAKLFDNNQLRNLSENLLDIDWRNKNGTLYSDLATAIELLLLGIYHKY